MAKPKKEFVQMTKVIRDCRNGSLDYEMPLTLAKELFNKGILYYDLTNHSYAHPKIGTPKLWVPNAPSSTQEEL